MSHLKPHTTLKLNFFLNLDDTNLSPTNVFSGHHDYEMFLLQKGIDAPHDNLIHHDIHGFEEQDQAVILNHATI